MSKITLAYTILLGLLVVIAGCDTSDDASSGGKTYPTVGSRVDVQFRRDYLGLQHATGTPMVGVMGEGATATVASSGELKKMTEEFVVLQVDNEPNREIWIPRAAVLMMDVKKKQ